MVVVRLSCRIKVLKYSRLKIHHLLTDWLVHYMRPSVHHGCTVAKRCKIWPRLLLIIVRRSHISFQITWKLSTLDDFKGHWQPVRSTLLATVVKIVLPLFKPFLVRLLNLLCFFLIAELFLRLTEYQSIKS